MLCPYKERGRREEMEGLGLILDVLVAIGGSLGVMLGVMFFLALVIQTATEFLFGKIEGILVSIFPLLAEWLSKTKLREGLIAIFTCGLGVWAAFLYQLDLIFLISELFAVVSEVQNPFTVTIFGLLLTGVMFGMGAGYLHDLIIKPLLKRSQPSAGDGPDHAG
jgi:hypothetical protein